MRGCDPADLLMSKNSRILRITSLIPLDKAAARIQLNAGMIRMPLYFALNLQASASNILHTQSDAQKKMVIIQVFVHVHRSSDALQPPFPAQTAIARKSHDCCQIVT